MIGVIVFCVGLVRGVFSNATLNEHSNCQQFGEADSDAQTRVLQDMMKAHNTPSDELQTTRASVTLYCYVHGSGAPIDGIYGSGFMNPSETQRGYANSLAMPRRALESPISTPDTLIYTGSVAGTLR